MSMDLQKAIEDQVAASAGEIGQCGHCGVLAPAEELKPAAHSPGLTLCAACQDAIAKAGHHQRALKR